MQWQHQFAGQQNAQSGLTAFNDRPGHEFTGLVHRDPNVIIGQTSRIKADTRQNRPIVNATFAQKLCDGMEIYGR